MTYSREGKFSGKFVQQLDSMEGCAFRKLSDRYQIGLSDIVGSFHGIYTTLEVKHTAEITNGVVRLQHAFTGPQIEELKRIEETGGLAYGIVACGEMAWAYRVRDILPTGQVPPISAAACAFDLDSVRRFVRFLDGVQKDRAGQKA